LAYLKYRRAKDEWEWLVLSYFSFYIALFAKETAVTLPILLIVYDYYVGEHEGIKDFLQRRKFVFIGYVAVLAWYLYIYFFMMPNEFYPRLLRFGGSYSAQAFMALAIFLNYIKTLFIPFTVLFEFDFSLNTFAVFSTPVIDPLTVLTG